MLWLSYAIFRYDYMCGVSIWQEFSGVGGLTESSDVQTEMTKVPTRTLEILASCHALVFVQNKLVLQTL